MDGFGFWLRWITANAVGELLGLGPVALAGILLVRVFSEGGDAGALIGLALFTLLGAFEGAVVGQAQQMVLRRRIPGLTRWSWITATTIGAAAAWFLGMLPSTVMELLGRTGGAPPEPEGLWALVMAAGMGLALGLVLAAPQWRVLRRHIDGAAWWPPANAVAWAMAMPLIFLAAGLPLPQNGLAPLLAEALGIIAGVGALVGAIHGAFLVWITKPARAQSQASQTTTIMGKYND